MRITTLRLWNFRLYREAVFRPAPGVTAVVGSNGSGKTSLLEAIAFFATVSSPRAGTTSVLVREGEPEGGAHMDLDEGVPLEVRIRGGRSFLRAGGSGVPSKEFLGRFRSVLFTPEDLDLVRGEPELRRRALDDLITQLRPAYRSVRQDYDRALRQRNAAIRQGAGDQAAVYNAPLGSAGAQVIEARRSAVARLRPVAVARYGDLAPKGEFDMRYRETADSEGIEGEDLTEAMIELYERYLPRDLERGRTSKGPHRDDLDLSVDGRDARLYASRGEQRSAALALRLSELELLPGAVLLLDDVLSELDPERRERVFSTTGDRQTIVSATEPGAIPEGVKVESVWSVDAGVLDEGV